MREVIRVENVLRALDEVVREFGEDHVYRRPENAEDCLYVHNDPSGKVPGCIAAMVLARLGVPLNVLEANEGTSVQALRGGVRANQDALDVLRAAQEEQDQGSPWGVAREYAYRYARWYGLAP